jgi:hypothetical protein
MTLGGDSLFMPAWLTPRVGMSPNAHFCHSLQLMAMVREGDIHQDQWRRSQTYTFLSIHDPQMLCSESQFEYLGVLANPEGFRNLGHKSWPCFCACKVIPTNCWTSLVKWNSDTGLLCLKVNWSKCIFLPGSWVMREWLFIFQAIFQVGIKLLQFSWLDPK